jgi:hypothetical protein
MVPFEKLTKAYALGRKAAETIFPDEVAAGAANAALTIWLSAASQEDRGAFHAGRQGGMAVNVLLVMTSK